MEKILGYLETRRRIDTASGELSAGRAHHESKPPYRGTHTYAFEFRSGRGDASKLPMSIVECSTTGNVCFSKTLSALFLSRAFIMS